MKGVGPPKYHLGGNFGEDKDGTLWYGSHTYVEKMLSSYERHFGSLPKKKGSPLPDGDHPETDTSDFLDEKGKAIYMSLVGSLQWAVTLNRFDIAYSVMVMSRFRAEPREGHMERLKHIYGYLRRYSSAKIRFQTGRFNHDKFFEVPKADWMHSVYGEREVEMFDGCPPGKGARFCVTTFIDSGLHHCKITGKASMGILQFVNSTPMDWSAKKQATVETTTYGAEFVAARHGVDATLDTSFMLRSFGVPLDEPAWMIGDNQSVVTSSTIPHSVLGKRWLALAYHRVRAAVAHGVLNFCHVDSANNVADIMTKSLGKQKLWPLVRPLLFKAGDVLDEEDHGGNDLDDQEDNDE